MNPEGSNSLEQGSVFFAPSGMELRSDGHLEAAGFTLLGFATEQTLVDETRETFELIGDAAIKAGEAMKTFSVTLSGLRVDALLLSVIFGHKPRRKRDRKRWVALKKLQAKTARDLCRAEQRLAIGIKEGSR